MLSRLRMPSPAMAVALLALFAALSTSAVAAVALKRNSVDSTHIKNGQVKRQDLANASVNSTKVRDGSLRLRDFPAGELPAGAPGATGARGPVGPRGPAGASVAKHETLRQITDAQLNPGFAVHGSSNWAPPAYWKDHDGVVRMQGLIDPSAASGSIMTLPAGYRPCDPSGARGGDLIFVAQTDTGAARIDITTGGVMSVSNAGGGHLSLSGISFPTDNCG